MTVATNANVTEVYVATFNRAPDADGLAFWVDDSGFTLEQISQSFFDQDETQELYPEEGTDTEFVTAIYDNLFNREPDDAGLAYWVDALETGAVTRDVMLLAVVNGAQGTDAEIVANKTESGLYYAEDLGLNGTYTLEAVTEDPDTVTAVKADMDTYVPQTFTLTTGTDIFEGSPGDDVLTGTNATIQDEDILFGGGGDDTLNLTVAAAVTTAPTIANVENINIDSTMLAGGVVFDATNVTDATISVTASKFGADGVVEVTAAGANNVTVDSTVTELTITDMGTATITTAGADVIVDTAAPVAPATGQTVTVEASADFLLNFAADNAGFDTVIVNGAVEVDLTGSTLVADDVVTAAEATIVAGEAATAATLTAVSAEVNGAVNVTDWTVGSIIYKTSAALTGVANAQATTISAAGLTVSAAAVAAATDVTVNTAFDVTSLTTTVFTNTTVNVSDDVTIGTLDAVNTATLVGTGDVVVSTSATSTTLDASGLTGDLDIAAIGAVIEVLGSTGETTYTTSTATNTFVGQSGDDDVTMGVLAAGTDRLVAQFAAGDDTLSLTAAAVANAPTVIADMGTGDDTVEIDAATADAATYTLDAGAGDDTLLVDTAADFAGSTLTLTNFENVQVATAGGATALDFLGSQLDGLTLEFSTAGYVTGDTLVTTITADEVSLDLSGFTVGTGSSFVVDAAGTATTILGSAGADAMTIDAVLSTVTGGTGSDTFTVTNSISIATMTSITDFAATATANDEFVTTAGAVNSGADVADIRTAYNATVDAIFTTATAAVGVVNTDGVLTLSGLTADKALVDTLADWVAIAEAVTTAAETSVFEFDGNTYVFEQDATADDAGIQGLVELVDLTGVVAVDTAAAAADTIFIS